MACQESSGQDISSRDITVHLVKSVAIDTRTEQLARHPLRVFPATALPTSTSVQTVGPRVWDSSTAFSPTTKVISGKIDVSARSVTPLFRPPDQALTNVSAAPSSGELETLPASKQVVLMKHHRAKYTAIDKGSVY